MGGARSKKTSKEVNEEGKNKGVLSLFFSYQSFRELPGLLTEETAEADSAVLHTASLGHHGIAPGLQRTGNEEGQRTVSPM